MGVGEKSEKTEVRGTTKCDERKKRECVDVDRWEFS